MGILGSISEMTSDFLKRIQKNVRSTVSDYCPVSGVASVDTLFLDNGCLLSIFKMNGISYLIGAKEQEKIIGDLQEVFSSSLRDENSAVQIVYQRDRRRIREDLEKKFAPMRGKAKSLGLNVDVLINERIEKILPNLSGTEVYCAVFTFPIRLVSKDAMKKYMKDRLKEAGPDYPSEDPDGCRVYMSPDIILLRHQSSVKTLQNAFKRMRMSTTKYNAHQMVKLMREMLFPEMTSDGWKARLPPAIEMEGDPISPRLFEMNPWKDGDSTENLAAFVYPSIGSQVAAGTVIREKNMGSIVKVGSRYVSTSFIKLLPANPKRFDELISQIELDIPLRMSFSFYGGSDFYYSKMQSKKGMAYLSAFTWPANKRIAAAAESMGDLVDRENQALCGISISFSTWADTMEEIVQRAGKVSRAIDAWGEIQSEPEVGDPFLAFAATVPGWTDILRHIVIHPVPHLLKCLPFGIVASPWKEGTMIFRDQQGGIFPYQPLSNIQQTSNILAFAPPGGGKSVLISGMILAAILDPVLESLPKIAAIDIGNSSKGVINLLRAAAPPEMKHRFAHVEFELSERFGINVMDTRLGCPFPTSIEKGFLVNFITMVLTQVGQNEPIKDGSAIASLLVDEAYRMYSEDTPQVFDPTVDQEVTQWLAQRRDIEIGKKTTWWQIVGYAMSQGEYEMAAKAQCFAVPNIKVLPSILKQSVTITSLYQGEDGEQLLSEAYRLLMTFIKQYPSLVKPSTYNFQDTDVCVIDLNKVTQDTGPEGVRRTTIAYMVSRYLLGKDFLTNKDILGEMNSMAQAYYKSKIMSLEVVRKYLIYDEFHRTLGATSVRRTVVDDMRNGRKFNLMVMLASQNFEDFDNDMIKQSTTRFVLRIDSPDEAKNLTTKYGWSDSVRLALSRDVRGAGPGGAVMLIDSSALKGDDSTCTQVVTSINGPTELAAYATTREDAALRDAVIDTGIPYWDTVSIIGKMFPSGVKEQVESSMRAKRTNVPSAQGMDLDEEKEMMSALGPFIARVRDYYETKYKRE